MNFFKNVVINLILFLALDAVWIQVFAGRFYAEQLTAIGRFTESGDWDIRLLPAVGVYICMSVAVEVFIFGNKSLTSMQQYLRAGALLGFVTYGVYDLTNRAVLAEYPMGMVVVDMLWGTSLFVAIVWINFLFRNRLNLLRS
jgi:uncharacterized membrane protein